MKSFKFIPLAFNAIIVTTLLGLSFSSIAASSTHSFSGGFSKSSTSSASKSSVTPSLPTKPTKSTSFGSFGNAKKTDAVPAAEPKSAMAQGLDTKASQATALQTLNAREAAKAPPSGFGNSSKDGAFIPSAQYSQNSAVLPTQQLPPVMQAPVYAPAYSGGGGNGISWGSAALGFMLGRATSHDSSRDYESNHRRDNAADSSGNNDQFSAQNGVSGMTSNKESVTSARSPQSTGLALSLLRIVLWVLLLSGTSWIVWRLFFKKKAIVTSSSTHYSLR